MTEDPPGISQTRARRSVRGRIAIALGVLALGTAGLAYFYLNTYEAPPVDPRWAVSGASEIPPGAVTVRYTGTATLVFSDGRTKWATDGWFTRPGPIQLMLGEIEPDLEAIERGLEANAVTTLEAIIPVHSHYDHAMDTPEVARITGALVLGSESTANIARGWGLPERQILVIEDRRPLTIGQFTVTPIESRHFEFPDPAMRERALGDPEITEPLRPPVATFDYKVGTAWALHVAHPRGSFVIQGSAGYREDDFAGWDADTVFLGVGGLGSQSDEYREAYWRETVEVPNARRVIPIHWDSLTGPAEGPFTGPVRAAGFLSRGTDHTLEFLKAKEAAHPELEFWTLPRFDEVVLF